MMTPQQIKEARAAMSAWVETTQAIVDGMDPVSRNQLRDEIERLSRKVSKSRACACIDEICQILGSPEDPLTHWNGGPCQGKWEGFFGLAFCIGETIGRLRV